MRTTAGVQTQRRSREELKELVLAAGLKVLAQSGPRPNPDALTYKAVFDFLAKTEGIRVTHASVHERIWASQAAFQMDVLRRTADSLPAATFLGSTGEAAKVVETADISTPEGRMWATGEMIRIACNADISGKEVTLSTFQAIRQVLARLPEDDPNRDHLVAAVEETRDRLTQAYVGLFRALAEALRVRPKPALGIDMDTALQMMFNQVVGAADGYLLESDRNWVQLATGAKGELQDWHLYSYSVWCAAQASWEADPTK